MDSSRLTAEEVENLRLRCQLRGSYGTAAEFSVPELLLLRAMVGLQVPEVVAKLRPMLAPLLTELDARKENQTR